MKRQYRPSSKNNLDFNVGSLGDFALPLSRVQKELLDKCQVPSDLQFFMGQQLDDNGLPVEPLAPDFLMILTDHLKASESLLAAKRSELQRIDNGQINFPTPEKAKVAIDRLEEKIKIEWLFASTLWKATDQVVSHAFEFGVSLRPLHVEYALDKKILSVVEIIRFAKPEFFNLPSFSTLRYLMVCGCGMIFGAFLGIPAGFMGAIKQCRQEKQGIGFAWAIIGYPLWGLLTGGAMGAVTGARIGLQTGYVITSFQLAISSAYLNPFHQAPGTKNQQAAEFVIQDNLFQLASRVNEQWVEISPNRI